MSMTTPVVTTGAGVGPSIIRTVVPTLVGLIVALGVKYGADLDDAALTSVITTVVTVVYYTIARFLETHASTQFGWLLGLAKAPAYIDPLPQTTTVIDSTDDEDALSEDANNPQGFPARY